VIAASCPWCNADYVDGRPACDCAEREQRAMLRRARSRSHLRGDVLRVGGRPFDHPQPEHGGDPALRLTPDHLSALVGAMRAGGVGVLRVGSLEIDLTRAPASAPVLATLPAPAGDDDERSPEDVLYRAGAGKRQRLPFGGRS